MMIGTAEQLDFHISPQGVLFQVLRHHSSFTQSGAPFLICGGCCQENSEPTSADNACLNYRSTEETKP
jgi:hypothetical protein